MYRRATIDDAPFISETVVTSWRDTYADFLSSSFLASLHQNPHHNVRSWENRLREPGSVTWIICNEGADAGVLRITIGASSIPGTDASLTTLYLLQQARRRGLGSAALLFARDEASRRGAQVLGVSVLVGNRLGVRFYEHRGAQRVGERIVFQLDNEPIMEVMYRFVEDTRFLPRTVSERLTS
ncbi:MAG: GNAT family N-acetyltransferase [Alphaproteobacteria bacterium]|nr:GNAT family N-acetyltransferase [Alphaproteobacteria bacterium]